MTPTGEWERSLAAVLDEVGAVEGRANGRFPLFRRFGEEWTWSRRGSWAAGHWVGLLWLRWSLGGGERPDDWVERIAGRLHEDTVARSMIFDYGAALGDRLGGVDRAAEVARRAAAALAATADPTVGVVPLGEALGAGAAGRTSSAVDSLGSTVRLLSCHGSPEVWARHLDRHLDVCLHADGAAAPELTWTDGRLTAHGDAGRWSRGQAWVLLALAEAVEVQAPRYLPLAERAVGHWVRTRAEHPPPDLLGDPAQPPPVDSAATAISAVALLKLSAAADRPDWRAVAGRQVESLVRGELRRGGLVRCCYTTRPGTREQVESVWGLYYAVAALSALVGALPAAVV